MNKTFKSCLVILTLLIVLLVAAVGAMFFLDICPPRGPWPSPPWCASTPGTPLPENLPSDPAEDPPLRPGGTPSRRAGCSPTPGALPAPGGIPGADGRAGMAG